MKETINNNQTNIFSIIIKKNEILNMIYVRQHPIKILDPKKVNMEQLLIRKDLKSEAVKIIAEKYRKNKSNWSKALDELQKWEEEKGEEIIPNPDFLVLRKDNFVKKILVEHQKGDKIIAKWTVEKGGVFTRHRGIRRGRVKRQRCTVEGFYPYDDSVGFQDQPDLKVKIRFHTNNRIGKANPEELIPWGHGEKKLNIKTNDNKELLKVSNSNGEPFDISEYDEYLKDMTLAELLELQQIFYKKIKDLKENIN